MYPSQKVNNLAHVAMTLIITVASTTASFSRTDITNATLATTSTTVTATTVSTDARTPLTAAGETPVDIPSETSPVKLTNNNTGTSFSIIPTSTTVATNLAVSTAGFETASPKNTASTVFATAENTTSHSTSTINKTLSPVQETISKQTTNSPSTNDEKPIDAVNTFKLKSTNTTNHPAILNATSVHQTLAASPLFNTITNNTNTPDGGAYVNITDGGKLADTESAQTLLAGSSFTRVNTGASEKQHLRNESKIAPSDLDKVAKRKRGDKNKLGYQWNSPSLSFWRQTVHLPRRRFTDFKNVLRRPVDVRDNKYSSKNADGYSINEGVTSRKLLTQKSTLTGHGSFIHSKITSTKPGKLFKFPSEPFNLETNQFDLKVIPSFYKQSLEINGGKRKLYFPEDLDKNNAENNFKKAYEIKTNDRQINFDIHQVSPDVINGDPGSKKSNENQNMLIPTGTSTNLDLLPEGVCHHCLRINTQKNTSGFLKSLNNRKRKRRPLTSLRPRWSKMQLTNTVNTRQENYNNNHGTEIRTVSVKLVKTDNHVNPKKTQTSYATENKKPSHRLLQKHSLFIDEEKKETKAGYIQFPFSYPDNDKTRPLISSEDKSLNYKDQTKSQIDRTVNFTDNTDMDIPMLSKQKSEKRNEMNYDANIEKTFQTEATYNVASKCKGDNLCPVERRGLPVTPQPIIHKLVRISTQTSVHFQVDSNTKKKNVITIIDKLQKKSEISRLNSRKYTKNIILEKKERNPTGDINVVHETVLQNKLAASLEDKQSSEDLRETETGLPLGENNIQISSGRNELSSVIEDSTVKIKDDILVGNPKQNFAKDSAEKNQLIKYSGTLPKIIMIDGDRLTSESIHNSHLINNDTEDIIPASGTLVRHKILKEDYTYDNFKAKISKENQNKESIKKSSSKISQRQAFLAEKHIDVLAYTDANVADLTNGKNHFDNGDSVSEINPNPSSDDVDEDDDIVDTHVTLEPIQDLKGFIQWDNTRKDREYSWFKNAYESIMYRQSHNFFLDPEIEKERLDRKILRRRGGRLLPDERQRRDTSTHAEDIYLYLQNTQHRYHRSPITSIYDGANILEHGVVDNGKHRTKRSTDSILTDSQSTPKFTDAYAKFNERVVDDDENKPCGNHGRHRSHVGGMHHLTRHQRRDIYREPHTRRRYPRETRFPSDPKSFSGDDFGKAAYFSGIRELLQLRVRKRLGLAKEMIPRQHFTIELWIKPEGGQSNPTVILGLFDMCHQDHKSKGWHIGIRTYEEGQEEDARIYFSLETDRANAPSVLMSDRTYEPNRWVHVAASYSGKKMKLYINTALVGVQHLHSGDIFSLSASSCKEIFLGGMPHSKEDLYRGSVDQILLWDFPLKHGDVVQNMFDSGINMDREKGIAFKESFDDLSQWKSFLKDQPVLHFANIEDYRYDIQLVAPPCGKTVCDDPDVIRSYVRHSELRQEKRVRYRIVNVMDDDDDNPKVSKIQTVAQHRALVATFKQYNISWELEEVKLRSTSLRHKTVLLDCLPMQIGDKHCNRECQHTQTGNDGGDCDPDEIPCDSINLGNGRCDFECNRAYYEWDKGDCCQSAFKSANSTCLDPDSPHRIYLSMDEYKTALNVNGSTHLNVYLASWSLKGLATFPWEKHVYGVLGGTVVDTNSFGQPGKMDGLIHEFGHNLGLWHVHHGVSEVKCDDPCMESKASLELGDLCSDTAPTAQNTHCRDPDWSVHACGISSFKNTPYRNYMSYASGNCTNHFTPQQVARMHCYLDLVYQPWQTIMRPSPVPLPPKRGGSLQPTSVSSRIRVNEDNACSLCFGCGTSDMMNWHPCVSVW